MEREFFNIFRDLMVLLRLCQTEAVLTDDITFTQFCILDYVFTKEVLGMSELHTLLSVEKSTTTRLVEPLIKKGLLIKDSPLHDSRIVELRITEDGKKAHQKLWNFMSGFLREQIKDIPEGDQKEMVTWVQRFISTFLRSCRS